MKKILIINPFGIGDVLFTTAVIRALKQNYPSCTVSYWCNERVKDIFENNPDIQKVFALSRGDLKRIYQASKWKGIWRFFNLLHRIKKEKFEIVFDFSLDHRYGLIAKLLGIKKRIGFNYKKRGRFLTDKIDIDGYSNRHVVEYYLDLLKFINIKPASYNLEIFVSQDTKKRARGILNRAGVNDTDVLVGLACGAGASWGKDATLKHWPALKFAQLADRVIERLGAKVLILGDGLERYIADIVVAAMKNKPIDLVGKTSLKELIGITGCLKVLVTNDGGPLHIAVALGIKTVSIFGPVDETVYGPYPSSPQHLVIKKEMDCRPCYHNFKLQVCEKDRECIKSISAEEVFEAIGRLW